jgi:hypothetical protein
MQCLKSGPRSPFDPSDLTARPKQCIFSVYADADSHFDAERKRMEQRNKSQAETSAVKVLVVIPCRNEEPHIERVVTKLLADAESVDMAIVVADGASTDGSRAIVRRLADCDGRIKLLDNPKRVQSAALNSAVRAYGDGVQFLIRADAHADYPDRFLRNPSGCSVGDRRGFGRGDDAYRGNNVFPACRGSCAEFNLGKRWLGAPQRFSRSLGGPRPSCTDDPQLL